MGAAHWDTLAYAEHIEHDGEGTGHIQSEGGGTGYLAVRSLLHSDTPRHLSRGYGG